MVRIRQSIDGASTRFVDQPASKWSISRFNPRNMAEGAQAFQKSATRSSMGVGAKIDVWGHLAGSQLVLTSLISKTAAMADTATPQTDPKKLLLLTP